MSVDKTVGKEGSFEIEEGRDKKGNSDVNEPRTERKLLLYSLQM